MIGFLGRFESNFIKVEPHNFINAMGFFGSFKLIIRWLLSQNLIYTIKVFTGGMFVKWTLTVLLLQ